MTLSELLTPFPWSLYSKKLTLKIENSRSSGFFTEESATSRDLRLSKGQAGSFKEGNYINIYWLVDKQDGLIIDMRYKLYGQSVLIGAAEAASEFLIGKNYDQARRLTPEILDKQLRDKDQKPAFPEEAHLHLLLVIQAIEEAAKNCLDLPLPSQYVATPIPHLNLEGEAYPGFLELPLKKKITVIEEVLNRDVRPYIELDAGGVEVLNLIDNTQVIIAYQGACTTCYSSIGTTLSYIQQVLRAKVHPDLVVVPNVDLENF